MRAVRIYQAGEYTLGDLMDLSATASQHVGVVLRMQVGAPLTLFCGDNREFSATIVSLSKKKVVVRINAVADVPRESSRAIHLVQAISKGDRMEMVIQKAVELGVASITPLLSAHCVVRWDAERQEKKQAQWKSIAVSACEQSGRNQLPVFHDICSFDSYLETRQAATQLILHPYTEKSWRDYNFARGDIALIIGPEGGWSDEEISRATSKHCYSLRLGPRVLRTETAAIAALSVLQAITGDL